MGMSLPALEGIAVVSQTAFMARSKKPKSDGIDREKYRKPSKAVRIRMVLALPAEQIAIERAQDLTQYVNDALREKLERDGRWPPMPKS